MHFSEELAREVLRAGALAYVLTSNADKDLLAAIDHVRHQQPFFTGQLANSMMQTFVDGPAAPQGGDAGGVTLTPRELDVVPLLAEGKATSRLGRAER